jgi:ubiquinone/menaquinone biosynthesis C-methylase UbiE
MKYLLASLAVVIALVAVGYWWRYRSLACPASLSWLLENPYMRTLAGPRLLFERIGLAAGMKVLDVGAGPGRLALPAAQQVGDAGEVVALDIQARMLDKLRARAVQQSLHNIRLVHAGAGSGQLEADYFDRALLVTVLGEIPDKPAALAEIFRALKHGGILSVTEVIPDPHYQRRGTVRRLCRDAGFVEQAAFGSWLAFTVNFLKE